MPIDAPSCPCPCDPGLRDALPTPLVAVQPRVTDFLQDGRSRVQAVRAEAPLDEMVRPVPREDDRQAGQGQGREGPAAGQDAQPPLHPHRPGQEASPRHPGEVRGRPQEALPESGGG